MGLEVTMKICLTCAAGGHYDELMSLFDAFSRHEFFFVTVPSEKTKGLSNHTKSYYVRNGPNPTRFQKINSLILAVYYFYLIFPCLIIFIRERPDVIVGSGGEATLHLSYFGKLLGSKVIYIESLARIHELSGTGKLVYHIADLFLVQWECLTKDYKKALYWGQVL